MVGGSDKRIGSAAHSAQLGRELREVGYVVLDDFVTHECAARIRAAVERAVTAGDVITVDRGNLLGRQRFTTINGAQAAALPELAPLGETLREMLSAMTGRAYVAAHVPEIALSVNVMRAGSAFSPHYDRHELTAILYLNDPRGGELRLWPLYRRLWPARRRFPLRLLQAVTDIASFPRLVRSWLGTEVTVAPRSGRLLLMWGSRTLHGVAPLQGDEPRYSVQFAYDLPHVRYSAASTANYYGIKSGPAQRNAGRSAGEHHAPDESRQSQRTERKYGTVQ